MGARKLYKNIHLSSMKIQLCLKLCWCLSEFILKTPMAHQIRVGLLSLSSCFWPCHLFFWIVNGYFTSTSSTKAVFFFWKKKKIFLTLCFFHFFFKWMHCFQGLWIAHHITNPAHYYALSTAACCNAIFTIWHYGRRWPSLCGTATADRSTQWFFRNMKNWKWFIWGLQVLWILYI